MTAFLHRRRMLSRVAFLVITAAVLVWQDRLEVLETASFQLSRGDNEHAAINTLVYVAVYTACILGIVAGLLHPWRWVRWTGVAIAALFSAMHVGFAGVNGRGFGHHEAMLFWSESQFTSSALAFFAPQIAGPVLLVLLVWAALGWAGSRIRFRRGGLLLAALPCFAIYAASYVTGVTFGKVFQFPAPARVPVVAEWSYAHRVPLYGERAAPRITASHPPLTDHLILVMDESISGHWLGVNGASPDTTPWLSSAPEGVFNYGIASAISNLSSSSNIVLQAGLRADDLPDRDLRALRDANIFSYMSAAGFRTAMIDAQSYSQRPPNMMTQFDIDALDLYSQLRQQEPGLPEYEVDQASLPRIQRILRESDRSFSYVLKNGAHLPYADKFPPSLAPPGGPKKQDESTLLDYMAAVQWSSDRYLSSLAALIEASGVEALVVYTADHGQSLAEPEWDASSRVTPHATELDPPSAQASVPLLLLAFGSGTRAEMAERFHAELRDRVSAFEIFPTLLESAGYDRNEIQMAFAPSLFDASAERGVRIFASGNIFAREGGFYILNPGMGSSCHLNVFQTPRPRAIRLADAAESADTKGAED